MNSAVRVFLLGLAVGLAVLSGQAPVRALSFAPAEPAELVDEFHAALKAGNAARAMECLDDSVVIYEEGEAELGKAEYARTHLPADIAFVSSVTETRAERRVEQTGAMALVVTQGRVTGTYRDRSVDRITTETMVLRRTDRGWSIVHIHWSSKAAPTN